MCSLRLCRDRSLYSLISACIGLILLLYLVECIFTIATGCGEETSALKPGQSSKYWKLHFFFFFLMLAALHIRSAAVRYRNCREM